MVTISRLLISILSLSLLDSSLHCIPFRVTFYSSHWGREATEVSIRHFRLFASLRVTFLRGG